MVEGFAEVQDSLVVHLEDPDGGSGRLILFVVPAEGVDRRRRPARPHRPRAAHGAVAPPRARRDLRGAAVPRTLSGKKLEVPVKRILLGQPVDEVASRDALADPTALDEYRAFASRQDTD